MDGVWKQLFTDNLRQCWLCGPDGKIWGSGLEPQIALSRQAVSLIMEYLQLVGREYDHKSEAALFGGFGRNQTALKRGVPLSVKAIDRIFAKAHEVLALSSMGIAPWTGHSARVGAAQDMAASGCTILQIMQAGRWGSEAMAMRRAGRV